MKKVLLLVAAAAAMLAACNIPQIQRDDVSFEGLKTFYVEAPRRDIVESRKQRLQESLG